MLPEEAISVLLDIYNYLYLNNVFPQKWSEAVIVPIHKPGKDKFSIDSYRPIALTCCLCKLLEKVVNHRLKWYLEKHQIISPHQSGFRKNRSAFDSIAVIENSIYNGFANNMFTVLLSLDIEKAYEMVWRRRIMDIITKHGIKGNIAKFVNNFIKERYINVRVRGSLSERYMLANGVPQGSVLSVTLFLLIINELQTKIKPPAIVSMYADDCNICITGKHLSSIAVIAQNILDTILAFSTEVGLKFSKTKSTFIIFSRKRSTEKTLSLNLGEHKINQCKTLKVLGLTLDERLSWIPHIKNLKVECTKRLNLMKIISHSAWGLTIQCLEEHTRH